MQRLAATVLLGLAAAAPAARGADEPAVAERSGWTYGASATAGYRMTDIDGAKEKYREDYDLRSGGRLFHLDVSGAADAPETTRLDRFRVEVDSPHDEPVSHFRLSAGDRSLYDLRADFTRSKYIYDPPQLYERAVAGDVRLDDLHDFNLMRTNGRADLTVRAKGLPTLFFGYRLYQRHGDATSTVAVPSGDTFVVDAPVDTTTNVGRVGTEFDALGTDVFLQQEYRRVDRAHDLGPVRDPRGVDPTDPSRLTFFDNTQDEHLDIPATTVRLRRPVGDRVELTGAYFFSYANLGFDVDRRSVGTTDVPGLSASSTASGGGGGHLTTHVGDVGASVQLLPRVHLHFDYRFNERNQDADLDERTSAGPVAAVTTDDVTIHRATSELQYEPRDDVDLRAGVRYARQHARFSQSLQDVDTDTVGVVAAARYRPWAFLDLFARYENARVDDPFTTPGDTVDGIDVPERQIALTFTNRASAGFRVLPRDWITLRYEFMADSRENDTFAARSQAFANNVGVTMAPLRDLTVFAGYVRRDLDDQADILLAPLYSNTLSLQSGSEDVVVSEVRWDFRLRGLDWTAGGNVAWVNAEMRLRPNLEPGLVGKKVFDLDRIDGGAFLTLRHRWLEPAVEFRLIDYDERALPRNDYRATIVAVKLTRRFGPGMGF
jgi:hypothetical protein